jgi:hypothetical protein
MLLFPFSGSCVLVNSLISLHVKVEVCSGELYGWFQ